MEVTILGAGTWGVTLAEVLNRNGCKVSIWHYKSEYITALSKDRYYPRLNVDISNDINLISSSNQISSSSVILICLPSQSIRDVLSNLKLNNYEYKNNEFRVPKEDREEVALGRLQGLKSIRDYIQTKGTNAQKFHLDASIKGAALYASSLGIDID